MNRSISSLFTALLFSVVIMPNAMAQMQPRSPVDLSNSSANTPERPASDLIKPAFPEEEVLLEPPKSSVPVVNTINSEEAPRINHSRVNHSRVAYCSIPPGAEPGDWSYREAMNNCIYGSD